MKKAVKPALLMAFILLLDQATKYLVRSSFALGESREVTSFFHLTYLTNTGIAFSMFQGGNRVFLVVNLVLVILLGAWFLRDRANFPRLARAAFLLIIAGALGNITDRFLLGHVTDFLDFSVGTRHWPAFNVADSAVCVGGFLFFLSLLLPVTKPSPGEGNK